MNIAPVVLAGRHIRLEPLTLQHHSAFCEIGLDEDIWRWFPTPVNSREASPDYIRTALHWQAEGPALPSPTIDQDSVHITASPPSITLTHPTPTPKTPP